MTKCITETYELSKWGGRSQFQLVQIQAGLCRAQSLSNWYWKSLSFVAHAPWEHTFKQSNDSCLRQHKGICLPFYKILAWVTKTLEWQATVYFRTHLLLLPWQPGIWCWAKDFIFCSANKTIIKSLDTQGKATVNHVVVMGIETYWMLFRYEDTVCCSYHTYCSLCDSLWLLLEELWRV